MMCADSSSPRTEAVVSCAPVNAAHAPGTGVHVTRPGMQGHGGGGGSGPKLKSRPRPQKKPSAEKILQSFNTWSFKREQPAEPLLMLQIINGAIAHGEPVPFMMYWGKGPRSNIATPEIECLDFLVTLMHRIRDVYEPGATFNLIFTDTHAGLNGHSPQNMRTYFDEVAAAARPRGFDTCMLSDLTRAWSDNHSDAEPLDYALSDEMRARLVTSASKWYCGEGTPEQGAVEYYKLNMIEKRAVQFASPRSIFVTFNGGDFRVLFPDRLPIFYMYSLKRGFSVKPWFLPA
jgi:hypothetical protein